MASARDESLVDLIGKTVADGQRLIKAQVALAQQELKKSGEAATATAGLGFLALGAGMLFVIFLLVTIAYVLVALGLPTWAGFGIVTLVLLIVVVVAAVLAKKQSEGITGPAIAIEEFEKTRTVIAEQLEG